MIMFEDAPSAGKVSLGFTSGKSSWLDKATKTIGNFWQRKNARRNGVNVETLADSG